MVHRSLVSSHYRSASTQPDTSARATYMAESIVRSYALTVVSRKASADSSVSKASPYLSHVCATYGAYIQQE
jgi:hypothetical protein